ncbi:MAG: SDR family oxidoreductase [Burkholderiaceae bacterium]
MQLTMNGRNALITGASLGIGLAMAKRFAGAGAQVALVARRPDVLDEAVRSVQALAQPGRRIVGVVADVSNAPGCEKAYNDTVAALGQLDVLVNNAGSSRTGKFETISDADWQQDLDLKLFAAIRLCRMAMPGMRERRFGRIINVLNTGAKAPPAGGAPTVVSRAAGMALTKVLAGEGAPHNVLVNGLLVGRIESDQWVRKAANENQSLEAVYDAMGRNLPMGRVGTAEEFANIACFLASDQGSYITGTAINVDGGLCPVV